MHQIHGKRKTTSSHPACQGNLADSACQTARRMKVKAFSGIVSEQFLFSEFARQFLSEAFELISAHQEPELLRREAIRNPVEVINQSSIKRQLIVRTI